MNNDMLNLVEQKRASMPVVEHWAYFDHAAVAPLSREIRDAIHDWADNMAEHGATNWGAWRRNVERARKQGARLINARADEVALIRSTTEGINAIANGIRWQTGDNVVTLDSEFPSNLYPWMNLASRGVELRQVPTREERWDIDQLQALCDQRTRLITLSWVSYATGWRNSLEPVVEFARDRGIRVFVDAIQGLGVLPLDVQELGIDFLAADGHKWMLGPEGAGLLFIRGDRLDELEPTGVGWNSVQHAGDYVDHSFRLKNSSSRYEGGTYSMAAIAGFRVALDWLVEIGVERINDRLQNVTTQLVEALHGVGATVVSDRSAAHWSGIVSFDLAGIDGAKVRSACLERGVAVNYRGGHIRLSPHFYTDETDIQRLVSALVEILRLR